MYIYFRIFSLAKLICIIVNYTQTVIRKSLIVYINQKLEY